ncbi:glutathionylspermidine synthase family protein [Paraglaciecola sp. L3A3]|uniref:glutathionylspermidine synthase family protein n=1 Tax=Paraglaciecola sp. L3A3 TaxID=2686358 RepID=UPI00131A9137|nr:glutathionylspermidine synthase family protein [Paraglaciecola sp. L3A3]
MTKHNVTGDLPFGEALGIAPGGVISYSSDYDTADDAIYPSRSHFRSYIDGIYMGYKWQCVEFARRWLYINKGYIFNDVAMAYEIFRLNYVRDLVNNTELSLHSFQNGSQRRPEAGCLLIWDEGGEFEETGHVAIITEVFDDKIRIVEQNQDFGKWPNEQDFSREIKAKIGNKNDYWLHCPSGKSTILGWVMQTGDPKHAVLFDVPDKQSFNILSCSAKDNGKVNSPWLNIANDDENAFVDMMQGHKLSSSPSNELNYYQISTVAKEALESATDELHQMFMHATDYALAHPELLAKFALPEQILAKIRTSWANRRNQLITSRFDFAMSENGLKVYEYNCDSASCYMEVAKVQGKWLKHFEVKDGYDAGSDLFNRLVKAWKSCKINSIVHVLQDDDPEETYHAFFMKSAIEAAGYKCEVIKGLSSLSWTADGDIQDCHGDSIKWVWKTWAWETALDELRLDDSHQQQVNEHTLPPTLADVLLNDDIMVFEPMWTLIPSNKAILPILCSLFPNHPLLLNTDFEMNSELEKTGYVVKPIVGRCGANIQLIDQDKKVLAEKFGQFENREKIYQQLFALPCIDNLYVQICTFTAQGNYAGSGVRVDPTMIIGQDSDCLALQVSHK